MKPIDKLQLDEGPYYWDSDGDCYATLESLHRPDFKPHVIAELSLITFTSRDNNKTALGYPGIRDHFKIIYNPFTNDCQFEPIRKNVFLTECPPEALDEMKNHEVKVWKQPECGQSFAIGRGAITTGNNSFAMGYHSIVQPGAIFLQSSFKSSI